MISRILIRNKYFLHLFTLPILLSLIGLFFIFESSSIRSFNEVGNSFYYLKLQIIWLCLGVVSMFIISNFDYHKWYYFAFFAMLVTMVLLVVVLIPGVGYKAGGARRWIDFGPVNVQPTELAKFSVIIYLSSWFLHKERKRFYSFLALLALLMFLIMMQPDMGTAIVVFFLSIIIYFLAGMNIINILLLLPVALIVFISLIKLSPYRFNRLLAFFDPSKDPLGISYHLNQILVSLSNGGIFGKGFGASRQKYLFLPEAHTDSIFAIIGEEVGFVGSFLIIALFIYLSYKMFRLVENAPDKFGKLLAGGIFAFFNLQILINLAGMVNLLPLTGIPMPFISYGGSNLLVSFVCLGILLNIEKKIAKVK
ncbi:MAG: Stage V sporulation protein E [Candidatus Roizmanbacteria bacterium GW2011_GWA2_36_23]|uniref:Probable peptidoglycan glycosyltransferase FtsW n=1 Tax=Candidatus Roizmanbacteria bacterium GW2011_GWA2_36_23 TaxID=1618480 RepID=A0A0G0E4W1_9BACT|nr:MAG: Stage V sporulation protein E [Candidatus Roizmanbacteria bacterium GW2011_GWA2_36_23]